ncbi:MAG: hypothetical protein HYZ28_11760 [Myxococcales bacterium]|nr:hypothetical protein [Myxococcales bacterium]
MKANTLTLSLALALAPLAARADHDDDFEEQRATVHVHDQFCGHTATPTGTPAQSGRYELRTVLKWVPGYHQQVWVPGSCEYKQHQHRRHRHHLRCSQGRYEQQWVPGRYETAQEWVWVPTSQGGYGWNAAPSGWRAGVSSSNGSASFGFRMSGDL